MQTDEELFHQLIAASTNLATVTDNAAVILSEEFENMVRPQIDAVRAVLAQCPAVVAWDGRFREDDCDISFYDTPTHGNVGVKIKHRPLGIGRQSDSKPTREANREVCLKALIAAVAKEQAGG